MAGLLFDATELKSFYCSTMQNYLKLSTKALSILVHFATTHFWKSGFSLLLHLKKISELFEPSKDLRMVLSDCVPRYKQMISDKQQRKVIY